MQNENQNPNRESSHPIPPPTYMEAGFVSQEAYIQFIDEQAADVGIILRRITLLEQRLAPIEADYFQRKDREEFEAVLCEFDFHAERRLAKEADERRRHPSQGEASEGSYSPTVLAPPRQNQAS